MPTPENLATDATVAIMLADGFETVEALAVADILFRAGVRTDLISVTDARHVTSSHGIRVVADLHARGRGPVHLHRLVPARWPPGTTT